MAAADVDADVLVIGGGLAGLRAAVAARVAGARVAIVVKGKLGRSGCSAMTTAGYAAALPGLGLGDSHEAYIADTLRGGARVGDRGLVEILCREAEVEIRRLEEIGAGFQLDGGRYRLSLSGDHSRARVLVTPNNLGTDLTIPLATHLESLGIQKLEFTMAVELLSGDDGVCGAVCFDLKKKAFLTVSAGATVVATGGAGRLFSVTSNPNDVTGDGFALAAAVGAQLRDMEFIQFYPWRCIDPFNKARVSIQPSTFVLGARLYNSRGARFMESFNPGGAEISTRDIGARGIFDQVRRGLGIAGGVRLDLSPLGPEEFVRSNPKVAKYLKSMDIDYATYPFIVSPEAHFWMGGLTIDRLGATSVRRLFAVGETAGGIHGANRLNSNALPDTQVFGARAGSRAADVARSGKKPPIGGARRRWSDLGCGGEGLSEDDLATRLAMLRDRMWSSLGIIRDADSMRQGRDDARTLGEELQRRGPDGAAAVRPWFELRFLCEVADLSLTSALFREESRGAHFRDDFPETDDARWQGSVMIDRCGGGGELSASLFPVRIEDAA